MNHNMKTVLISFLVVITLVCVLFCSFMLVENGAFTAEERIAESYSGIELQLKHRNDSINQLVQVIEDLTNHETEVMKNITKAREELAKNHSSQAMQALNLVVENYPEIKSDVAYNNLMLEISSCENMIASFRNNYNEQVRVYKSYIRTFPEKQILNFRGYEPIEVNYLDFEDGDLTVMENMFGG